MKSSTPDYIMTDCVKSILRLSNTAVQCSSYFAIRGVRGVGKTTVYSIIVQEWLNSKAAHVPYYYECMPDDLCDGFIRGLAAVLARKPFPKKEFPSIRGIIDEVGVALRPNKSTFLFVDNADYVDETGWSFLITLFDSLRQKGLRLGMAVTDRFLEPAFRTGRPDPALMDIVHLKAFDQDLTFSILEQGETRISRLANAYYKGNRKAAMVVKALYESTNRGNFLAIESLLLTLKKNLKKGQATDMDIRNCLSLRAADVNSIKNQFQLSAS